MLSFIVNLAISNNLVIIVPGAFYRSKSLASIIFSDCVTTIAYDIMGASNIEVEDKLIFALGNLEVRWGVRVASINAHAITVGVHIRYGVQVGIEAS